MAADPRRAEADAACQRAEAVLRATEDELHRAQALALIGNFAWDAGSDAYVASSPEGYRIFGFTPADLPVTAAEVHARIHPDDWPAASRARQRALQDPGCQYDVDSACCVPMASCVGRTW